MRVNKEGQLYPVQGKFSPIAPGELMDPASSCRQNLILFLSLPAAGGNRLTCLGWCGRIDNSLPNQEDTTFSSA